MNTHRQLSPKKRALFRVSLIVIVYVATELFCLAYLALAPSSVGNSRSSQAQSDPIALQGAYHEPMMIHPYIGVVYQPTVIDKQRSSGSIGINEYGLLDDQPPYHQRGPNKVIVGIVGGSVAKQLGMTSTNLLAEHLGQLPRFAGKKFEFVRLAIDGQKQPQHLTSLSYLLATGGELDILICLDGVNEIALPAMDNVPFGIAAAFPRKWSTITTGLNSIEMTRAVGYLTYLREERIRDAAFFDTVPLKYSPLWTTIWQARDRRKGDQIATQLQRIQLLREQETLSPRSSGPKESFATEAELLEHCADIWCRSSIAIEGICRIHDIRYFHFLQPNQYLPGSRTFGRDEAAVALNSESPFARPVELGYPLLQQRADRLREAGVDFTDLTLLYKEAIPAVYSDDCCHMTNHGDELMAQAIAERIRARLQVETDAER